MRSLQREILMAAAVILSSISVISPLNLASSPLFHSGLIKMGLLFFFLLCLTLTPSSLPSQILSVSLLLWAPLPPALLISSVQTGQVVNR